MSLKLKNIPGMIYFNKNLLSFNEKINQFPAKNIIYDLYLLKCSPSKKPEPLEYATMATNDPQIQKWEAKSQKFIHRNSN
jgi:hypothetical protein